MINFDDRFLYNRFLHDRFLHNRFLGKRFLDNRFLHDKFLHDRFLDDIFLDGRFLNVFSRSEYKNKRDFKYLLYFLVINDKFGCLELGFPQPFRY